MITEPVNNQKLSAQEFINLATSSFWGKERVTISGIFQPVANNFRLILSQIEKKDNAQVHKLERLDLVDCVLIKGALRAEVLPQLVSLTRLSLHNQQ